MKAQIGQRFSGTGSPATPIISKGTLERIPFFAILSWSLAGLMLFLIVYPVGWGIIRAFTKGGEIDLSSFAATLTAPWLPRVLFNTLAAVVCGGALALVTASIFAWLNERTDARLGIVGDLLPLIPLLLPTVALAIGWIFLGSPTVGFINRWLDLTINQLGLGIRVNIQTWGGLIFVYALYFVPYVYVIVASALRNIDGSLEEASRASGAGLFMTMRRVSLPAIRPALIGAMLLITMVGMSLYSVPAIIATRANIDILSVRIIQTMTNEYPPRTDEAVSLASLLLVFIFAVWTLHRRVVSKGHYAQISGKSNRQAAILLGAWKWPARLVMIGYLAITSILPVFALVIVSLQPFWSPRISWSSLTLAHYERILFTKQLTQKALFDSLLLGVTGGVTAMVIAGILALYIRRNASSGPIVDGVTKFPAAFSHVVIGIGFLVAFSGPPLHLAGTLLILFLAYIVMYLPEASIAASSAFAQVGKELVEASEVAGAGEARTFRKIIMPLTLPGMLSGAALVFVLMIGELTASSMLAGVRYPVIGFVIIDIWESGQFGELAAVATTITVLASAVIASVFGWMHYYRRRHGLGAQKAQA
ncbi:iron ABC transporter permease [Chelativorans sp. Marseille-P2723]|uniref:ABC transporter permease n=1 Tax=Chelativorans sp. Marseille-P2723 TaxID=2709133 RepID=UPI0015714BD5|nr:iron ABC transporter permease [Chelativorans sp. Marseille-P2723]